MAELSVGRLMPARRRHAVTAQRCSDVSEDISTSASVETVENTALELRLAISSGGCVEGNVFGVYCSKLQKLALRVIFLSYYCA